LKLIVVHYHLRPGGIRRVIELATPHIVRAFDREIDSVVLACGEATDRKWNGDFRKTLQGVSVEFLVEPAFKYFSEQKQSPRQITRRICATLRKILDRASADSCLVWTHNPGVGRNLLLTRELTRACAERNIPLIAHHHDWWFDNRWSRWPEMRRCGFRTLRAVAETIFPPAPNLCHVAINQADARILQRHFRGRADWLPNLTQPSPAPAPARIRATRKWLDAQLGEHGAPVWILPCRLLRRKNIAEALLLTRWLRPGAWLVTTGGVSSADEQVYANRLASTARRHGWRLRLGILGRNESGKPGVNGLIAASEAVVLTSIQEGFGLPYLEAAAVRRPLIARAIPNITPDLRKFGFSFPQIYDELLIDPRLFDWPGEVARQKKLFAVWRNRLPQLCRKWTGEPFLSPARKKPRAVPFNRLTLTGQLEVLGRSPDVSWKLCAALNPLLQLWKKRADRGHLQVTPWPRAAAGWLDGRSYACRFTGIARAAGQGGRRSNSALRAQEDFLREKLGAQNQFPLLWSRDT
jgi:hypothetical protein